MFGFWLHLHTESKFVKGIGITYTSLKNVFCISDVSCTWQSADFTMVSAFCALRKTIFGLCSHSSLANWYSGFIKTFYIGFLRDILYFYYVSRKSETLYFETREPETTYLLRITTPLTLRASEIESHFCGGTAVSGARSAPKMVIWGVGGVGRRAGRRGGAARQGR